MHSLLISSAKVFSLTTQKADINIIEIVDSVETTKRGYEKLLKKLEKDEEFYLP